VVFFFVGVVCRTDWERDNLVAMNSFGDRGSDKSLPSTAANSSKKGLGVGRDIQRKLRYVFNYFDRDEGGTMGMDELRGLLSVLEDGDATDLAASMMKAYCKEDSNEELEFSDFLSMISSYYKKHKDVTPFASDCFNIFDRSNTNTINKDDISKVMSAIGEDVCELEIESMMNEAGCEVGDEGITEDQFYRLLKRLGLTDEVDPEAPIIVPNATVKE